MNKRKTPLSYHKLNNLDSDEEEEQIRKRIRKGSSQKDTHQATVVRSTVTTTTANSNSDCRIYDQIKSQNSEHAIQSKLGDSIDISTIDFRVLASQYPDFTKVVKKQAPKSGDQTKHGSTEDVEGVEDGGYDNSSLTIDWKDAYSQMILTKTILKHYFKIEWGLPIEKSENTIKQTMDDCYLIPPVLNRLNYIRWIHHFLSNVIDRGNESEKQSICGIDIGTGANVIYPLLGHAAYGWNFVATDINEEALKVARQNVESNGWSNNIQLVHQTDSNQMIRNIIDSDDNEFRRYDFLMCNPPFFTREEFDARDSVPSKPNAICTGNRFEMITEGGEVVFVKKIIDESIHLSSRVAIYTSMLGKKASINPLMQYLRDLNITSIFSTEFKQGRTSRWAIAWTFDKLKESSSSIIKPKMAWDLSNTSNLPELIQNIKVFLSSLPIVSFVSIDASTAMISGSLDNTECSRKDHFTIQIIQKQPKQYVVELKFGSDPPLSTEFAHLANSLDKRLKRNNS